MTEEERAFKAGWYQGHYDGGEHDCRMFLPTAESAWEDFKRGHLVTVYDKKKRNYVPCVPPKEGR